MKRYYIGLATTFHDPALAIVDAHGKIVFAEASERALQYKRAVNCEADPIARCPELLRRYLDPDCEVVVATSWDGPYTEFLARSAAIRAFDVNAVAALPADLNRSLTPLRSERALIGALHAQQQRAGLGLLIGLTQTFGHARMTLRRYPHHLTHAAYAAIGSPFEDAACLVVDGMGETGSAAIYRYSAGRLEEVRRYRGRESVGFFFGLMTDLCGFDQAKGEEWKVMGLAPYGARNRSLVDLLRRFYRVERGALVFPDEAEIAELVAQVRARTGDERARAELARAAQDVFEEMMSVYLDETYRLVPSDNLVLTGGCALNSSFNGKILSRTPFRALHVPSAPADDGNAVGAALCAWRDDNPEAKAGGTLFSPYLGTKIDLEPLVRTAQWEPRLVERGEAVVPAAARLLAEGKLVGWVQGRAEFGPRALGNRSILADPRPADAKDLINLKVKLREPFRPFAPAILHDEGADWFENYQYTPYMERTLVWREDKRARVPAVVHVDGTGRLQSVTRAVNPRFYDLIATFRRLSGVPILLNTSFNVMGKPILHSADEALLMLYTTGLDALVVEDWLLVK